MTNVYFTSDNHFGHEKIIEYCLRPFRNVSGMNFEMIRRWNERVATADTVYHLGDFAMGDPALWKGFLSQLNGHKILVAGNHDSPFGNRATKHQENERFMLGIGFDEVHRNIVREIGGVRVWMNHYPGPDEFRGHLHMSRPEAPAAFDIALCGHIHQLFRVSGKPLPRGPFVNEQRLVNVGVDVFDFRPVTLAEIDAAVTDADRVGA